MFFDNKNTKKINDLADEMSKIRRDLESVKLDLELYTKKLKASKGIIPVKEALENQEEMSQESVFLTPEGKPLKNPFSK